MLPVLRKYQLEHRDPWSQWFNRFFDDVAPQELVAGVKIGSLDVYEDQTHLHVEAELPGFQEDQIEVTLENGLLYMQAQREDNSEKTEDNYYLRERSAGKWSRSVRIPVKVQEDKVQATYKNGLLRISLEKEAERQSRKINLTT